MSTCEHGQGRCRVWLEKKELDNGILLILGGGESHIGGLVYKEPGKEPESIKIQGHRDMDVLLPLAQAASEKYGQPVVVTGGIHIEKAAKHEIEEIINNCKELLKCI